MKTHKIFGPPGTGKTTRLLTLLDETIKGGVDPSEIAYFTHTRSMTEEAIARVMASGKLKKDCGWFRTSHSAANKLTGLAWGDIWSSTEDWIALHEAGYPCSGAFYDQELEANDYSTWDVTHFVYGVIRARRQPLPEGIAQFNKEHHKLSLGAVEDFAYTYERVKQERGKKDFADMIEMVIDGDFDVPFKVLFIDEAQDFSRMQWEMIRKLMPHLDKLYIAGDDDQSIFPFTGSDPFGFLDFPADTIEVLEQSYRVPHLIGRAADRVIARVQRRQEKVVKWTTGQGIPLYPAITRFDLPLAQWAQGDKDVMILCRHRRMVKHVRGQLEELGLPSKLDGKSSDSKVTEIAIIYHDLKSGREVSQADAARLLWWKGKKQAADTMRKRKARPMAMADVDLDFDANWVSYLSKSKVQTTELFKLRKQLIKNGIDAVRGAPKIDVSTYHSAKGREADIVVCLSDCSQAVVKAQNRDPDTEIRLAYVGLTRAKETVMVLPPGKTGFEMVGLKIRG